MKCAFVVVVAFVVAVFVAGCSVGVGARVCVDKKSDTECKFFVHSVSAH